jgi:hypothetical protein
VWEGTGVDTYRDLYGATEVYSGTEEEWIIIQLQDPSKKWVVRDSFYSE